MKLLLRLEMAFAALYDQKVIQKQFANIEITTKQRKTAQEWIKKIKNNELKKEVENYNDFRDMILIDLLGYPKKEIKFEEKDVEFSLKDVKGRTHVVFEAKGTKTKDLFARQNYGKKEQEHPVLQTVSNMQRFAPPAAYGICTNYNNFVLIDRELGITKCHRFTFIDISKDLDKLKEFIGIFSYENLVKKDALQILYEKSVTAEKEFTKEFYKLFHETRLMMIKAFQEKEDVSKTEAIYYTQIFLNRLIFIFFVEDREFILDKQLFAKRIFGVLESDQIIDVSKRVYDVITELFVAFDKGSTKLGIFGFNGGLFGGIIPNKIYFYDLKEHSFFSDVRRHSKLLKTTTLNEKAQKIINRYENKLNPIISNLLVMESFDFNTEVNVEILGHIFEQSISDLEELKGEETPRRKKDGVYYTPEYITDHICRNTIIPYLSKSNVSTIAELIQEYDGDIDTLEKKFKEIKILDPACGSGAFLNKAVDTLLEIHKEIIRVKDESGKYSSGKQVHLTKWNEEAEIQMIIENNIYGVDVNRESVEITKLSLFLKLASNNRKLIGLSKNIKIGNSLISDKTVDDRAFSWDDEFPEVMSFGKFDIIVGNPPYLNVKGIHANHGHMAKYFKDNFMSATQRYDLYVLFVEKASKLLKNDGILSFIIPHKFINAKFGTGLRKYLVESKMLNKIISFGHNLVFEDSTTYTGIITLQKSENKEFKYAEIQKLKTHYIQGDLQILEKDDFAPISLNELKDGPWILNSGEIFKIMKKIKTNGKNVMEFFDMVMSGLQTGDNEIYVMSPIKEKGNNRVLYSNKIKKEVEVEKEILKPLLTGEDVKRYTTIKKPSHYVIYPYTIENKKQQPIEEEELAKKYPMAYKYLSQFKEELIILRTNFKTNPKYWYALHRGRALSRFEQEKILTPEISLGCNMTMDTKKFLHLEVVYSFLKKQKSKEDARYLLGVLNSKVMWFFLKNSGDVLRGGFFRFKTMYIEPFSIPCPQDKKIENQIATKVSENIELNKEFAKEHSIFMNWIQMNLKIEKPSKILKNFYVIDSVEFFEEIKNKFKIHLNIDKQAEWIKEFELFKDKVLQIKTRIIECDKEINRLVYPLYKLSQNDIDIIEKNYPNQWNN